MNGLGVKRLLVELLAERRMTIGELQEKTGMVPSVISRYLDDLELFGAVGKARNQQGWRYYTLKNKNELLLSLIHI